MAAADLVETGMKLHAKFSDGEFYPAEVVTVKAGKNAGKKPVKIKFTQYPDEKDVWMSMDDLKSKKLPKKDAAPEPKAKAKAKAKAKVAEKKTGETEGPGKSGVKSGKDGGAGVLGKMTNYKDCVLAEYIWLDAEQVPRSKTKVMTSRPKKTFRPSNLELRWKQHRAGRGPQLRDQH